MSYDGDELPIRPPRRAQTLPVRFATETDPYPPNWNVAEAYAHNRFPARREPYSPRVYDAEAYVRYPSGRHSREADWAFGGSAYRGRVVPPVGRHRDPISHSPLRRHRSRVDLSDDDSAEVVVIEENSPELKPRPVIINNRSGGRARHRSWVYEDDHFDIDLEERAVKDRLRRVRNRSRTLYPADYSSSESETDPLDQHETFSFSLSRHTRSPLNEDGIFSSISELSEKESKSLDPLSFDTFAPAGKAYRIFRSQYTGDGIIGGLQTAELKFVHDIAPSTKKGPSPIFQWVHFEDISMNLDGFENGVDRVPGLANVERRGISRLFTRVRRKFDKPIQTSQRMKARFMVPSFLQETISTEIRPKGTKSAVATWLCLPYFCLEKYTELLAGSSTSSHPMRTLLQARFSLVQKRRDLQQAVCQFEDSSAEHCFHIAQLWCLVLEDSLLVTCARVPLSVLQGESISVISVPSPSDTEPRSPNLLVSGVGSLLWSFPLDECLSWFAFISHFGEFWPRSFVVIYNGKPIISSDWPKIVAVARKNGIRLSIEFKSSSEKPRRGVLMDNNNLTRSADDAFANDVNTSGQTQNTSTTPKVHLKPMMEDAKGIVNDQGNPMHMERGSVHEPGLSLPPDSTSAAPATSFSLPTINFHVFIWLNLQKTEISAGELGDGGEADLMIDKSNVDVDLEEIDQFLMRMTNLSQQLDYQECTNRRRRDVYDLVEKENQEIRNLTESGLQQRKDYENKVDLLNAADSMFQFFLPVNFDGPCVGKYWGAVFLLIAPNLSKQPENRQNLSGDDPEEDDDPVPLSSRNNARACAGARVWLETITHRTEGFRKFCSRAPPVDRFKIKLPEELTKAWLHLLISLIVCTKDHLQFEDQMATCYELLEEGMRRIVRSLTNKSLLDYGVFKPFEVASLLNLQILQDVTRTGSDISDTYSQYLRRLECDIEANPLDRGYQDKITLLKQEISVIGETLRQQKRILDHIQMIDQGRPTDVRASYERVFTDSRGRYAGPHYTSRRAVQPAYYEMEPDNHIGKAGGNTLVSNYDVPIVIESLQTPVSQLSPTDPSGVQGLLNLESQAVVDKRLRDFREINDRASDLETWNIQKIDSNKDRQEAAIYAFTTVTIIFLPLSAVAGIMGMNTNDIRNMELNQWVYWAVALPLAVVIILVCLAFAGELRNSRARFAKFWSTGGRERSGYTVIPETYGMMEPRTVLVPASRTRTYSPSPRVAPPQYYDDSRRHRRRDRDYV